MIIAQYGVKHNSGSVNIHELGTSNVTAFKGKPMAHL